jgi:hypothetical protein
VKSWAEKPQTQSHRHSPVVDRAANPLFALQRTAGNSAVSGVLQRQLPPAGAGPQQKQAKLHVQREPILTAATSSDAGPGKVPPLTPDELRALNVEVSTELRRLAGNAIGSAVEQFHRGCDSVKSELEKRAKQQSELIALVADIVGGFAVPALAGRMLADVALRKTLTDSVKSQRLGGNLAALATEIDTMHALKKRGADLNPQFWEKVSGDNIKATFTSAVKGAGAAIKNIGPSVLTGNKAKIIDELSSLATAGRQDLDRSLATKSESELLAIIVALDVATANQTVYAKTIARYLEEVIPIGASWAAQTGGGTVKLVRMNAYGGWRLAVVESGTSGMLFGTPYDDFKSWVSPGMQTSALARAGLPVNQAPLEVVLKMVPVMDPAKMSGSRTHLPPPTAEDSALLPI